MKSPPLLILFANLKGNLGDFAILHAMLVDLERRYPGREVHVLSHGHQKIDDRRLEAFRNQSHPAFIYRGTTPYRRPSRMLSVIKRIGLEKWLSGKLIDRMSDEFGGRDSLLSAGDYEAIFLAGGEQWGGFSSGINMFAILQAVSRQNRNVFMFPFSIKRQVLNSYSEDRLKSCFSRISGNLVVRDSRSGETMRRISPRVINGADCVFLLADSVASVAAPERGNDNVVIIATTEADGSRGGELLSTIKTLIAGGYRVRLLTTCEKEDARDMLMLSRTLGIDYLTPSTWQEAVAEFRSAALVVTNRLHCMIFTFFADVPLLPLLNREKVLGVFRDAELPHSIANVGNLTPAKVAESVNDSEHILGKMRTYLERVRELNLDTRALP